MTANTAPQPPHSSRSATHAPLHVRKLLVDLSQGFARHWHGGDSFRTQYFNALSMSFPVGEQFFIDSVREAAKRLGDSAEHQALRATITDFCSQEATHRHVHSQYNQHLAARAWSTTGRSGRPGVSPKVRASTRCTSSPRQWRLNTSPGCLPT